MHRVYAVTGRGLRDKRGRQSSNGRSHHYAQEFQGQGSFPCSVPGVMAEGMRKLFLVAGAVLVFLLFSWMCGGDVERLNL